MPKQKVEKSKQSNDVDERYVMSCELQFLAAAMLNRPDLNERETEGLFFILDNLANRILPDIEGQERI